tara:strand:- start:489 stop:1466 length:978 start_codon:yes stop_codon:yes gene_type:complete
MKLLVVGGAGYIGSHIVLDALEKGYKVTVFDDLTTGSKKNLSNAAKFIKGTTLSTSDLLGLFESDNFDCVIHLAANKASGESMLRPSKYATNNIAGSINLINFCANYQINSFIFSSSAAVYGVPEYTPIDESHPVIPNNYYGYTKLMIESNLTWFSQLKGMNFAALRYFNAAGYDTKQRVLGLENNPQNLIPLVMETAIGKREKIHIFGNDYSTKDGTGVRDYIHVSDLASAHLETINYIKRKKKNLIINLGSGSGHSVLDIINKVQEVSGISIDHEFKERRQGDVDIVMASSELAKDLIQWETKFSDLNTIIRSTWSVYNSSKT